MKKRLFVFAMVILVAGITFSSFGVDKHQSTSKKEILNVSDVQAKPAAYKGSITITGVVAKFSKEDPNLFAIIDTSEAKHCKSTGCAKFYLAVRHDKELPKEWDEINATGHLVEKSGLLFEATKIEILRHLTFKDK